MRWIAAEVFVDGEPNPFPAGTAVVRRRMRAVPLDRHPVWSVFFDVYGLRSLWRIYDRRAHAVVGHAWVRRSALRRRRTAWVLWVLAAAAAVLNVLLRGPGHEQVVHDFAGELFALLAVGLLLTAYRISAVLDRDTDEVGIRG